MAYRTPKDVQERKDEKRRHILATAAVVFAAQGFHETSVKDIADQAGVSVGSFYFYFKGKEDLFEILYDEMYEYLFQTVKGTLDFEEKSPVKRITYIITAFLKAIQCNKELARIMLIEAVGLNPRFEKKRAQVTRMFSDELAVLLERMKGEGEADVIDSNKASVAFIGTVYNTISNWLHTDASKDISEYAYQLVIYNLRAFNIEFAEDEVNKYIKGLVNK